MTFPYNFQRGNNDVTKLGTLFGMSLVDSFDCMLKQRYHLRHLWTMINYFYTNCTTLRLTQQFKNNFQLVSV